MSNGILKFTDKDILDWMAKEGLESLVRVPQFNRDGSSLNICFWASLWRPKEIYVSLRGAAMAAMTDSKRPTAQCATAKPEPQPDSRQPSP